MANGPRNQRNDRQRNQTVNRALQQTAQPVEADPAARQFAEQVQFLRNMRPSGTTPAQIGRSSQAAGTIARNERRGQQVQQGRHRLQRERAIQSGRQFSPGALRQSGISPSEFSRLGGNVERRGTFEGQPSPSVSQAFNRRRASVTGERRREQENVRDFMNTLPQEELERRSQRRPGGGSPSTVTAQQALRQRRDENQETILSQQRAVAALRGPIAEQLTASRQQVSNRVQEVQQESLSQALEAAGVESIDELPEEDREEFSQRVNQLTQERLSTDSGVQTATQQVRDLQNILMTAAPGGDSEQAEPTSPTPQPEGEGEGEDASLAPFREFRGRRDRTQPTQPGDPATEGEPVDRGEIEASLDTPVRNFNQRSQAAGTETPRLQIDSPDGGDGTRIRVVNPGVTPNFAFDVVKDPQSGELSFLPAEDLVERFASATATGGMGQVISDLVSGRPMGGIPTSISKDDFVDTVVDLSPDEDEEFRDQLRADLEAALEQITATGPGGGTTQARSLPPGGQQ